MTTVSDQLFQHGGVPVVSNALLPADARLVAPAGDYKPYKHWYPRWKRSRFHTTIPVAYNACEGYKNEVVHLALGDHTLAETLTWSKHDTHLIGTSLNPYQPHLDIWQGAAFTPMVEISGRGNVFANMTFRHGTDAADVVGTLISGRYNYFENVYWYGPMVAGQDVAGYRGVKITGHENRFKGCRFGNAALMRDQKNYNVTFEGQNNWFEDCIFYLGCDGTAPHFCGWRIDEGNEQKMTVFKNCTFICYSANWVTAIAYALYTPGDISGGIYFDSRCQFVNVTAICNVTVDQDVWIATPGATAATAATLLAKRNLGA